MRMFAGAGESRPVPVIGEVPSGAILREVSALAAWRSLIRQSGFDVLLVESRLAPALLLEVARVRELAFRLAGEGTGKSHDLDRFDEYYDHLILWDREECQVAGAYRLIRTGPALERSGPRGLYTASLFHLSRGFFEALGPAIELGRSFVHPAYQRKPHSLLLLWRGIGRYLTLHPECQALFGPVSISGSYSLEGRRALVRYLQDHAVAPAELRRCARAREQLRRRWPWETNLPRAMSLEEADELLRRSGGPAAERGMPVLLRQYLRVGGQVVACSVDRAFGHCLDALVVLDLRQANRERMQRMLGFEYVV